MSRSLEVRHLIKAKLVYNFTPKHKSEEEKKQHDMLNEAFATIIFKNIIFCKIIHVFNWKFPKITYIFGCILDVRSKRFLFRRALESLEAHPLDKKDTNPFNEFKNMVFVSKKIFIKNVKVYHIVNET